MSYTETVRLPYTLWYDGKDKTIRMDMNSILSDEYYENGKKHISKIRNFVVGSYNTEGDVLPPTTADGQYLDASALATIVYNEQKHYTDITLKSHSTYNADGEIVLWIDFEMYTGFEEYISDHSYQKKSVALIIPFRSHENPSKNPGRFNDGVGIERLDLRNGMAHTVGAKDEPIVFSFDLIKRDITDEFITSGQALDLITEKRIVDARLNVNDSGLGLSLNYKSYDPIPWETLQQHLGSGSNSTEYVPPTLDEIINSWYNADNSRKSDFANAVGSKMTLSVSENSTKDIDVFVVRDVTTLNGQPTKSHELLFTIPRSLLGGEGGTVDTESIKNSILSAIQQQIPNAATIKQEILADVNPRIPDKESLTTSIIEQFLNTNFIQKAMNRGTISAHDINELLLNGPDESNEVTHTILENTTTWNKHVKFIKSDDHYEVSYYADHISPRPLLTIPFSELREATGGAITLDSILEALKDDTKENVLTQIKEKLSIVNTDTLKHELLNALPAKDDYNLSYDGVSLYLTKTNDSSYMKSVQITPEISIEKMNAEVLTSKLKPELDKSYYSKQEVDQLIQQLKHELMSEDHAEEHPQQ